MEAAQKHGKATRQSERVYLPKNKGLQEAIAKMSLLFRKECFTYQETKYIIREARLRANLIPIYSRKKPLPVLPSAEDIEKLLTVAESNIIHWLIIKMLITTGLRITELVTIKKSTIYLDECKIFIGSSKTGDRYVLFPESLRVHIIRQIQSTDSDYLFYSRLYAPYTRKGVWKFIKKYGSAAGIDKNLHPHLFRHYWITEMAAIISEKGLEILSGNKDNLDRYIHLNVERFRSAYSTRFS